MPRIRVYLLFAACAATLSVLAGAEAHRTYYVDCSRTVAGSGDSPGSAWNDLRAVNAKSFSPGDTILLRRETSCHGTLAPLGSGAAGSSIHLSAYGEGKRPRIVAGPGAEAALRLFNQEYWEIDSLDLSGSQTFGVFISGDKGVLHHIYVKNLAIHDVVGGELKDKESGLLAITPGTTAQHFDDVLIDGVTAWNTNQWAGIVVGGGNFGFPPRETWSTHVVIRNSTVHDVQGDGIVLFRVRHGSIESSVAWNTGMQVTQTIGTPNAIWTWMCEQCAVTQNEAFLTDSPGVDGGAFDIDYGNTDNSVIDNYGHDTQGYCVAVFGAGFVTRASTVRGNLCINNGRSPRLANFQGAIFLHTWNGGSIDGLTVEKNTVYWSPYEDAPALINDAEIRGGPARFEDNVIRTTSRWLMDSKTTLSASRNQYHYFGAGAPRWRFDETVHDGLAAVQRTAEETESKVSSSPLAQWTEPDAKGTPLRHFDAASEFGSGWTSLSGNPHVWPVSRLPHLYVELPGAVEADGLPGEEATRQLVIVRSIAAQYRPSGLAVTLLFTNANDGLRNVVDDMELGAMDIAAAKSGASPRALKTVLVTPEGKISDEWDGLAGPVALGLAARRALGEPVFSQMVVSR
jgi:hypothetical protein